MKHYYVTGPGKLELVDEPIPTPGDHDLLVKMSYTALSPGSNVFVYQAGSYSGVASDQPGNVVYMGSGIVEAVGAAVTEFKIGDRVAMMGPGHQEYVLVPVAKAHKVPESVHLRDAAIGYLSSWAISALHLGQYAAGETVVVVGQGLVGASAALMADQMGARVLALDVAPERVAFSQGFGLGLVEQPGSDGWRERIDAYLAPHGPDLILEASGAWAGLQLALELARDYTRIALMGLYRQPPPPELALELFHQAYDFPSKLHYKRLQIIGCGYDPEELPTAVPRMATREGNFAYTLEQAGRGRLQLGKLVSHVVPADDIESILDRFVTGDKSLIGVVFDWTTG